MAAKYNITILKGATFTKVLRWESAPLISKLITGITRATPVRVTAVGHGMPDGWRAAIVSAGGMTQINSLHFPPRYPDFSQGKLVDADTVDFIYRNSSDYDAYTSGGYLVYLTPMSLAGFTARMDIRSTINSSAVLLSLTTVNGRIILDDVAKTITLTIDADATDDITWTEAVYDLELVSAGGVVTRLIEGNVIAVPEVTHP